MELTNIKDLFREKESYAGKKVTVGRLGEKQPGFQNLRISGGE